MVKNFVYTLLPMLRPELYDAVNRISDHGAYSPLEILKIESGTSLAINLKGMGEPIKQIKELPGDRLADILHRFVFRSPL
jgi:hypothetical protein